MANTLTLSKYIQGNSIALMWNNARGNHQNSGTLISARYTSKSFGFANTDTLEIFATQLIQTLNGLCHLSKTPFKCEGHHTNNEGLVSLDRIDSEKGYEEDNLQLVCRFINRWKSTSSNEEFLRLVQLLRAADTAS